MSKLRQGTARNTNNTKDYSIHKIKQIPVGITLTGILYVGAVWLSVPCATASGGWTMRTPIKSIIIDNDYKIKLNIFSFNS